MALESSQLVEVALTPLKMLVDSAAHTSIPDQLTPDQRGLHQ
jgi:hypothetical protein